MALTYPELSKHLQSGQLAPVYVLAGSQDLLRELAAKEIQNNVLGEGDATFNFDKFDGERVSAEQVVVACNMFPLMASHRLVMVKRAAKLAEAEAIAAYLESPSPQATLVLELEKAPDTRRKSWKRIEKRSVVVQCDPLKDRHVESWIADQALRLDLSLGKEEVRYLVTEFGSDLRRQLNELEKISLYAAGRKPGVEELATLLGKGKAQSVFKFTDAVADRDAASALKQLGRLLEEGESPLPILALIDRTVGQLLTARELGMMEREENAARRLSVPSWKVDRVMRRARRFSEEELLNALQGVARCDRAIKTTGVPARLLLEGLVLSICRVSSRSARARSSSVSSKRR